MQTLLWMLWENSMSCKKNCIPKQYLLYPLLSVKRNLVASWLPGQGHCFFCHSKCHAELHLHTHFLRARLIPVNSIHWKPPVLPKPEASSSFVVRGKRHPLLMTDSSCPQPGWVWKIPSGGICFSSPSSQPLQVRPVTSPAIPAVSYGHHRIIKGGKVFCDHWDQSWPQCYQDHHLPTSPGVTSSSLLNTSRGGDSTTAFGSPFQCLSALSVKKISSLNFPWWNLRLLAFVLSLDTLEKRLTWTIRRDEPMHMIRGQGEKFSFMTLLTPRNVPENVTVIKVPALGSSCKEGQTEFLSWYQN